MNGILLIDKPEGCTSYDVVSHLKRTFSLRKVGHGGTLDPLASGLLVMLIGKATRLAEYIIGHNKTYRVVAHFGEHRDSFDADGGILKTSNKVISEEQIRNVFENFPDEYMQVPPVYSAKKIAGKASYKLARAGKQVNLAPVRVKIRQLELIDFQFPRVEFLAEVSSGTYIRSLVVDIAERLGTVAYVEKLRRIKSGNFDIKDAYSLDDVLSWPIERLEEKILPMSLAVAELEKLKLSLTQEKQFTCGGDLILSIDNGNYSVFSGERFIGICKIADNKIISRKVFIR